jgi:hypothetical protein
MAIFGYAIGGLFAFLMMFILIVLFSFLHVWLSLYIARFFPKRLQTIYKLMIKQEEK